MTVIKEYNPGSGLWEPIVSGVQGPAGANEYRNLIINGDFRINQRAFTSTTTSGTYGFDRWQMLGSGGTTTYSTQAFSVGNAISGYEPINYARIVSSGQSAASSYSTLTQKIESVRTLAGSNICVSFWAKASSGTPKIAVDLFQYFGTGGSPSSSVSTYLGQVTLSTSWQRFTVTGTVPSISGKTIGTANDDSLNLNLFVSAGSDFNSRTGSLGIQSNTFDIWGVQVEGSSSATDFEQRFYGVELLLCQRYYQSIEKPMLRGVFGNATAVNRAGGSLLTRMRAAPVITTSGTHSIYDGTNIGTVTSISVYYSSIDSFEIDATAATGTFTAGRPAIFYNLNDAKINCSSEL